MIGMLQATPQVPARTTRAGVALSRYAADPEYAARKRAYAKAWVSANPERRRLQARIRYATTPRIREWLTAYMRRWRAANPIRNQILKAVHDRARRARKHGDLTPDQWQRMLYAAASRCTYCSSRTDIPLTMDHVIPLSKGGHHTIHNVVPACAACNGHKGVQTIDEWLDASALVTFRIRHADLVKRGA